jgi:uncharacterized membrane protein YqjE
MDPNALEDDTLGHTGMYDAPANDSGVLEKAQSLWHELHGLAHDRFHLAALETQRAGQSLVAMMVMAAIVSALLIATWLGLIAVAVLKLVENGFMASSAILLAIAFNLLLVLILCDMIRRRSRYLLYPATLRSFNHTSPERSSATKNA